MTPRRVRQPRNVTATRLLRYQLHLRRDTTITSTARRTHRIMIIYQVSVECRCLGVTHVRQLIDTFTRLIKTFTRLIFI